jgi:structural maintenance of chromosome 1
LIFSRSGELEEEYEELKTLQERAIESSTVNFNRKRGISAELKLYKEQKEEADKYQKLIEEKVR